MVAAGAICKCALERKGILIGTHVKKCAGVSDREFTDLHSDIPMLNEKVFAVLEEASGEQMQEAILAAASEGDSVGGILETAVIGVPEGLGEPWFDTMEGLLSHMLFSIPGVKGVEFGAGFAIADLRGSQANDPFRMENGRVTAVTNNSGGINGGITNGMPIVFRTAIKPTPTIFKPQNTIDFRSRTDAILQPKGRHDPAIVHRARIVQDAATAIVLCDALALRYGTDWLRYGCIGKKLTHSFSREIHAQLADYQYDLIELTEEEIAPFFAKKSFAAINVTIPYKQTVIPYLDSVSPVAQKIGAVNTIVNKDGKLYGYNTDYHGMKALIEKVGIELTGKKVLILGTGGTSKTARVLAADLGAARILIVSRRNTEGCITYEEAVRDHTDTQVIINTTPSGMYPNCEDKPIDIGYFSHLEGVIDAVYNPLRTNLVLDAQERGIKAEGGLYMLVMQAVVAVEYFLGTSIQKEIADQVFASIYASKENIVLTGMPGSGKSTVGRLLDLDGFTFVDTDAEIEKRCGCAIKDLIREKGEAYFRNLESAVIQDVSSSGCRILSTGGGAILREENVRSLRRNGKLFFLNAELSRLQATDDRPLSDTKDKLKQLYAQRLPIYQETADVTVPDMATPMEEASYIISKRKDLIL